MTTQLDEYRRLIEELREVRRSTAPHDDGAITDQLEDIYYQLDETEQAFVETISWRAWPEQYDAQLKREAEGRTFVDELLARGAKQLSRKYRNVACLPQGMTAVEALRQRAPDRYDRVMEYAENLAANDYRLYVAEKYGDHYTLSFEDFEEFREKTGHKRFIPSRPACEHCKSLGHMHRRDCPNLPQR